MYSPNDNLYNLFPSGMCIVEIVCAHIISFSARWRLSDALSAQVQDLHIWKMKQTDTHLRHWDRCTRTCGGGQSTRHRQASDSTKRIWRKLKVRWPSKSITSKEIKRAANVWHCMTWKIWKQQKSDLLDVSSLFLFGESFGLVQVTRNPRFGGQATTAWKL